MPISVVFLNILDELLPCPGIKWGQPKRSTRLIHSGEYPTAAQRLENPLGLIVLAPVPAARPDLTDYLAGRDQAAIPQDIRQVVKTECQAEADGPQLALVLACARTEPSRAPATGRTVNIR